MALPLIENECRRGAYVAHKSNLGIHFGKVPTKPNLDINEDEIYLAILQATADLAPELYDQMENLINRRSELSFCDNSFECEDKIHACQDAIKYKQKQIDNLLSEIGELEDTIESCRRGFQDGITAAKSEDRKRALLKVENQ